MAAVTPPAEELVGFLQQGDGGDIFYDGLRAIQQNLDGGVHGLPGRP